MGLLSAVTFGQVDAELLQESKEHKKKHKKVDSAGDIEEICTYLPHPGVLIVCRICISRGHHPSAVSKRSDAAAMLCLRTILIKHSDFCGFQDKKKSKKSKSHKHKDRKARDGEGVGKHSHSHQLREPPCIHACAYASFHADSTDL